MQTIVTPDQIVHRPIDRATTNAAIKMRSLACADAYVINQAVELNVADVIHVRSSIAVAAVSVSESPIKLGQLQQFIGAAETTEPQKMLWFFAASTYTQEAIELADKTPVLLFTYSGSGDLTPMSESARKRLDQVPGYRLVRTPYPDAPDASPWAFSTLHRPGQYSDPTTRRIVFWSGEWRLMETPREAELNCAAFMRALGHWGEATPVGADGGIDVRTLTALAQVKLEKTKTGRPALQQLRGSRNGELKEEPWLISMFSRGRTRQKELWFFSLAGYRRTAWEYAETSGTRLFTYLRTGEVSPVNQSAKDEFARCLDWRSNRLQRPAHHWIYGHKKLGPR